MRSIFKARYDIFDSNGNLVFDINEENDMVRVMDSLFGETPKSRIYPKFTAAA